ncbi:hypothetical protein J6590_023039 [Homalodisca vitripennis]|nr:hypothetical protein J6590_023039 [Homalodisca vitripennis]
MPSQDVDARACESTSTILNGRTMLQQPRAGHRDATSRGYHGIRSQTSARQPETAPGDPLLQWATLDDNHPFALSDDKNQKFQGSLTSGVVFRSFF